MKTSQNGKSTIPRMQHLFVVKKLSPTNLHSCSSSCLRYKTRTGKKVFMANLWVYWLTHALSLPVYHRPLVSTPLCLVLLSPSLSSWTWSPLSTFSSLDSIFPVFLGRPLPLWPCGIHCNICLAVLSSLHLSVWPIQFHFLFRSCSKTGC